MIKFYAFLLSCLTFLLVTTPAYAGRLLSWRFEVNQNRLLFTTDQGVQPTAQLIANPTRLVIDLPGTTLGRPSVNETYGGLITGLRIGQFDARTTRLVIELAPGYILDPSKIKVKGLSPTQWSVDLPQPQRGNFPASSPSSPSDPYNSSHNSNSNNPNNSNNSSPTLASRNINNNNGGAVQVTSSGLIVGIDGDHKNRVKVDRSRDGKKINFEISNLNIPNDLLKSWAVNQYGVENVEISQKRNSVVLLTLNVHPDSPDWQGTFSRMGGFVLWPQGGINRVIDLPTTGNKSMTEANNSNSTPARNSINTNNRKTLIEAIEINNNQLVIRGNQRLQGQGSWTNGNQMYQLRLENTELAPNFQSPTLSAGSPISRLRIWQPDDNTVVLLIEPALGTRLSNLQSNDRVLTLPFIGLNTSSVSPVSRPLPPANNFNNSQAITQIPVSPAPNSISPFDYTPTDNPNPRNSLPSNNPTPPPRRPVNNGRVVVMIDPGHGGKDVGAVGIGGIQEKHIVLSVSQQVARILEQQGIQVRMTRDSDYFVTLEGRTQMANRINADLFVSIHANSAGAGKPQVNGYETYYFTPQSKSLADTIHRNVIRRVDVNDRRIRQARFYVIRTANMPSVLLELGFVTGSEDSLKLTNPTFQRQIAEAIASGIIEYIRTNRL